MNVVCRVSEHILTRSFDRLADRRVNIYKRFVATHTNVVSDTRDVRRFSPPPRLAIDVTMYYDVMFPDAGAKFQNPKIPKSQNPKIPKSLRL